jgi:hypothetical protein
MAARTTAVVSFAICFIFGVGCSWCGAVAKGGSWGGCVDNGGSCGVVSKLSDGLFGALAGARFFFGFRPRLLGIGEQYAPRLNNTASATAASPAAPTAARRRSCGHTPSELGRGKIYVRWLCCCRALRRGQIVHAPGGVCRTIFCHSSRGR